MVSNDTIALEDTYLISFFPKLPLVVEKGSGVDVWDVYGKHYIDFTSGWAVTSLGHTDPIILKALQEQAQKILHNPDAGGTYAPSRAALIRQLLKVVPQPLHHFYFVNSGAEANDSAIKLARKITGRRKVLSTNGSFHGRTIGTTSVTGQAIQRDRYAVVVPHCEFVPYNDIGTVQKAIDDDTAAIIVEPIQGEGGVRVPADDYLVELSVLCRNNGTLLIVDEIQTGFWRTGPVFMSIDNGVIPDFLTMAKGIAGGFPFGAVAVSDTVAQKIETGDHGGTYCGNPLGCAVAAATIEQCLSMDIETKVRKTSRSCLEELHTLKEQYPGIIKEVRGRGLLLALEFNDTIIAEKVRDVALENGLILNLKHGTIIRIFPALTIQEISLRKGCAILAAAVASVIQ